jgi:mono/diheme cytochrome c family protein
MMARRIVVAAALGVFAVSGMFAAAQQKPQVKPEIITGAPVNDAKVMFQQYCSPCHGKTGKGDGPAATAMKKVPADLTKISARNGGVFPEAKVSRFIAGLDEVSAHGSRDMPVWGDLFKSLPSGGQTAPLRVQNLTNYLKSIQQ